METFAERIRREGIRHAVLLGMGGSSLGPEALRMCFGPVEGRPELIVLDSTLPSRIRSVSQLIDSAHTLFIVSSKSGTTIETNMLYRYFRAITEAAIGAADAGSRFVAVTDAGTPLDSLAERDGFRHVFRNPPHMGGRYSTLSYFGLLPLAIAGYDIQTLLERAAHIQSSCAGSMEQLPSRDIADNPGAWLGAVIGALARAGRDKLTLVTSPSLEPFGLWTEQLIAESLGKDGVGIVPVVGEPLAEPSTYGEDRLFICLTLADEEGSEATRFVQRITDTGHPAITYEIESVSDIGGEIFRWEFATALAGAIIGVQPFDQPDVQLAKDLTQSALAQFESNSRAPAQNGLRSSLRICDETVPTMLDDISTALLSKSKPGDYLAILAYIEQTPETDSALFALRRAILEHWRLPTTAGYGPRYLHSTGQLHKGGADSVAALILTKSHDTDTEIPGASYTFGELADAQASSDIAALESRSRRVTVVELADPASAAIRSLAEHIAKQQPLQKNERIHA